MQCNYISLNIQSLTYYDFILIQSIGQKMVVTVIIHRSHCRKGQGYAALLYAHEFHFTV